MRVREVMKEDVKTINENATVKEAAQEMKTNKIGGLLVMDSNEDVIGIITERDILEKVAVEDILSKDVKIKQIMTKKVITIDPDAFIEDAADLMNKNKIKKLPVLWQNKVVGIITATELIAAENTIIEKLSNIFPIERKEGAGA